MRHVLAAALTLSAWVMLPSPAVAQSVAIQTTVDDLSVADQRLLRGLLLDTRHLTALALLGAQRSTRSDLKAYADRVAKDAQAWSTRFSDILGAGTAAAAPQPIRSLLALEQSEGDEFDAALLAQFEQVDTALLARIGENPGARELTPQVASLVAELRPEFEAQAERRASLASD